VRCRGGIVKFGLAVRNFTGWPELPDPEAVLAYGVEAEERGFESLWTWDHILLGVKPCFPILESVLMLTALAARTSRIKLGTGILVLPLRNPLVLAKQLATLDLISNGRLVLGVASGWYKREFDAVGIPFNQRGKLMDRNLELLKRLWQEDLVDGDYPPHALDGAVMMPKPVQKPRPPILIGGYVDRVLRRAGQQGDGWLTYFYTPESFTTSWQKVREYAHEAGRDPAELESTNQLPIVVGESRKALEPKMNEWLRTDWDYAGWSESTPESAIIGTPEECAEQLQRHVETGVDRLILVPYRYEAEQVRLLAEEVIPRVS
jgi:probable F420-dependent oxidoreductase